MCGRFEVLTYEEVAAVVAAVEGRAEKRQATQAVQAAQAAQTAQEAQGKPRAQARPGSSILLFGHGDASDNLEIEEATWGFDPEWSSRPVFNTRVESMIEGSPMWRDATANGRCVIPAASFYEPHATETVPSPRTGRPLKRPYQFASPDGEPLLMAGVQADGRCSVVTCEPNRWVVPIHNRMPLLLRFEEVGTWLSPEWPALADRSAFQLHAAPEHLEALPQPDQLSLF